MNMSADLNVLSAKLTEKLGAAIVKLENRLGEVTIVVAAADANKLFTRLRDDADFQFEQLIDLCGIDYSAYGGEEIEGGAYQRPEVASSEHAHRFAAVSHLLSVSHNWRLRVRVYAEDDNLPQIDSIVDIWPSVNWYEREAFDLFGIIFTGHPDLRRILTDYGFVGNPFRKDFPLSGQVEMRYDAETKRVVYQPVSIEPRLITPRSIREENYGRH
jgi:NADH-quinone oxidoreductase subunit C